MSSVPISRSSNLNNPRTRRPLGSANNNPKRPSLAVVGDDLQLPRTTGSPSDIPAPVASLLASTAIPVPRKRGQGGKRQSTQQGELRGHGDGDSALELEKNCLDILLSDPNDDKGQPIVGEKSGSVSVERSPPLSIPSLDHDDDVSTISSSSSSRQSIRARRPLERKQKLVLDPETCGPDHPLRLSDDESDSSESDCDLSPITSVAARLSDLSTFPQFPKLKARFKSNLTTSFQTLKAAAHTVSNFATPSIWVDNNNDSQPFFHISPVLTDDKRPNPCSETPSPELRRYLNPHSQYDQSIYSYYESSRGRQKPPVCLSSIQMQTYSPSSSSAARARLDSETVFPEPTVNDEPIPSRPNPRHHREARENSDFLRMLVLEQSMRRQGKIQSGRARVWLPPRLPDVPGRLCSADVPAFASTATAGERRARSLSSSQRWVGLTVD